MKEEADRRINNRYLAALNHPNFRLFFAGQLISVSGTWMQRVAQGWLVFNLTQSTWWLGIVACVSGVIMLTLAPVAGVWTDRFSRRNLLIMAQATEMTLALLLAYLTFTAFVRVEHIVALAGCLGLTTAVGEPARQALLKDLVEKSDMASGLSLNATMSNIAAVVGPTLAGIALIQWGAAYCFLINGLSYLAVLTSLVFIRITTKKVTAVPRQHIWRQVHKSIRYVAQSRIIAVKLLTGTISSSLGIGVIQVLLPAYASDILGQPEIGLAASSAAIGFGSIIAAIGNVGMGRRWGQNRLVIFWALLLPFGNMLLAQIKNLPIAALLLGILGFGYTIFFVTANTLIQLEVDDDYRGRVLSLWSMNRFGITPIASLVIGGTAQLLGISVTLCFCGLLAFILCFWLITRK